MSKKCNKNTISDFEKGVFATLFTILKTALFCVFVWTAYQTYQNKAVMDYMFEKRKPYIHESVTDCIRRGNLSKSSCIKNYGGK